MHYSFFGIFFLVISFFSLTSIIILQSLNEDSGSMSEKDTYSLILIICYSLISLSAMVTGYKLIKRLDIGRILFNILTVVVILISIAQNAYNQHLIGKTYANMPADLAANLKGNESSSSLSVFILPVVLILISIVLNWRKIIRWLKS